MAAPTYATDLVAIIENIASITGWSALGGGASGLGFGPDFAMQGANAVDKAITASEKGQVYAGSAVSPGANTHFFLWGYLATPGLSNTIANRGLAAIIGTGTTAYMAFHVEGSDTYGAAGRVGKCYPIRYNTTPVTGVKTATGSPGASPAYFGFTTNITGTVKGSNLGISAMRYGTGMFIVAGDAGTPANFSNASAQNDAIANRWGILTKVGVGFELQGRFVVGQNTSGTPTAAYFKASNQAIAIVDTPHSLTDFTQIIVDHASTYCELVNINIKALGANNPGQLVFNNASTTGVLNGCTFENIGISTLRGGVTATGCVWRACDAVTLNGATLSGGTIESSIAATSVIAATLSNMSGVKFVSDGSNHAVDLGTISSTQSMTWACTLSGYAASNGSTGNEAIKVNVASGQTLTINVSGGASTPSIYNTGSGTVVVSSGACAVTISDLNGVSLIGAEVRIYDLDGAGGTDYGTELDGTESSAGSTFVYSGTQGNTILVQIMKDTYAEFAQQYIVPATASAAFQAILVKDVNA